VKRVHLVALLGCGAVLAQPVPDTPPAPGHQPAPAAPTVDPALMSELDEIDSRGAKIEDLTADFEQEKFTALLKRPLSSEGRVRVRPPRTRWDTAKPHKSVLLLDERELKMYDPQAGTLEVYDISGGLSRMTSSPVPRLAAVKDEFAIERIESSTMDAEAHADAFLAVRLTPTDEKLKEHVTEVRVLIDRATACATRVEVTDADGDRTVIKFKNLRLNTGIDAAALDLKVPDGTRVSHPLEAGAGDGGGSR
jgi:outer membrane lipoprotein carrier protein